jgi:IS1 family transposase
MTDIYTALNLPASTRQSIRIYKKQLLENADLTATDRKHIQQDIDTLEWRHVLKAGTCDILPFKDEERDYSELHLIHVTLKSPAHIKRLGEVLQRAIQYPLLLVFEHAGQICIQMADKRINRADSTRLTVEASHDSGWLAVIEPDAVTRGFLQAFRFDACDQQHLYALWQCLTDKLAGLETARYTGHYVATPMLDREQRRGVLQQLHALEQQLANIRATLKRETQFNRKLELNMQAKQCQQQLQALTAQLD